MTKTEMLNFWDSPDFKRQQVLIAGSVPWDKSEANAAYHRTLIATSLIKKGIPDKSVILELGCGVGRLLFGWERPLLLIGVDISPNMLAKADAIAQHRRVNPMLLVTDNCKIDFPNNQVNLAYSFLVFQHIQTHEEIKAYMKEIYRLLAPGGFFRVQTFKGQPQPEDTFGEFHGRFYPSLEEFQKDLEDCVEGFTTVEAEEGLGHPEWLWLTLQKKG
jgi:ubiquinone/menaquinone biosynthesis C-methylase UbiE